MHGWKAATAVFGCGTLAAFGVFGVIVGVLSLIFGTLSTGVNTSSNGQGVPEQAVGQPVEQVDPGQFNLCEQDVQYSHGQNESGYVSSNYNDPALDGEESDRTITDECIWEIAPPQATVHEPWTFTYSYEAVVSTSESEGSEEVASRRFDQLVNQLGDEIGTLAESGEADISERSYYHYGRSDAGDYMYFLVGQTRSTVYVINFVSPEVNGEVGAIRFTNEARSVASMVEPALKVLVPD